VTDNINHPPHYTFGSHEPIDVIEDWSLSFCLGNVVKYIARAGRKSSDRLEDLKKARWYLNREIEQQEKVIVEASSLVQKLREDAALPSEEDLELGPRTATC
jgi:hypothetical protein